MTDTSNRTVAGAAGALTHLERLLLDDSDKSRPPVHLWDPAARPDIGLVIQRDGTWIHQGSPIERIELVKLFSSVLRREADGRYFIVTPVEKVPIRVVDAPFLAVEMEVRGAGDGQELIWRTNVDDVFTAGTDHPLRFELEDSSGGLKPYISVRYGLEARVTRALYYDLVNLGDFSSRDGVEHFGVWTGGQFFPMAEAATLSELEQTDAVS